MIIVKSLSWATLYEGTRDDLIRAGLAVSGMFENWSGVTMSSKRCKSYHPEQGKWRIVKNYKENGEHLYRLYYQHDFIGD